jgi:hypothetical protein
MDDVDPNIDETLVEYELSKMDRMAKTVSAMSRAYECCRLKFSICPQRHKRFASVSETASPLSRSSHAPAPPISSAFTPSPVSVGDGIWRRSHAHSVSSTTSPLKSGNDSPGIYRPPHLASATGLNGGEFGRRRGATLTSGPMKMDDRLLDDSWRVPSRAREPSDSIFGYARRFSHTMLLDCYLQLLDGTGHNSVATTGGWGSRR